MTDLPNQQPSIPSRLGVGLTIDDGQVVATVEQLPAMMHHGLVRVSVLAFAADAVAGLAVDRDPDRWSFTSDLALWMRATRPVGIIEARGDVLREGRRSSTTEVHMVDEAGRPIAYSALGFASVDRRPDDPPKPAPDVETLVAIWGEVAPLDRPLREAAGIEVVDAARGIVEVAIRDELRNPAGALQGAMVALIAEVAMEELTAHRLGRPALVTELAVRYLVQARVGPVRTRTEALGEGPGAPVLVELVDVSTGRLLTHVMARALAADDIDAES